MANYIASEETKILDEATHLGKYWAALRDDCVVSFVSMRVPNDVDFEDFGGKAKSMLEALGTFRAGEMYQLGMDRYFLPRLHSHQNRSKKNPKVVKPIKLMRY